MKTINRRIEKLLDRDHVIGHSYFLMKKAADPEVKLLDSFYRSIIPLLQEYFYGDYAKIGAVLGKGFVRDKNGESEKGNDVFADFDGFEPGDFSEKPVYEIVDYRDAAVYHSIARKGKIIVMDFPKAIQELMNSLDIEHEA
jgi:5-methylcytosine-specific restriction enzyme B